MPSRFEIIIAAAVAVLIIASGAPRPFWTRENARLAIVGWLGLVIGASVGLAWDAAHR